MHEIDVWDPFSEKVSDGAKIFEKSFRWSPIFPIFTYFLPNKTLFQIASSGQDIRWKLDLNTFLNFCRGGFLIYSTSVNQFASKCRFFSDPVEISTAAILPSPKNHVFAVLKHFYLLFAQTLAVGDYKWTFVTKNPEILKKVSGGANIFPNYWYFTLETIIWLHRSPRSNFLKNCFPLLISHPQLTGFVKASPTACHRVP